MDPISHEPLSDPDADRIETWYRERHERVVHWITTKEPTPHQATAPTDYKFEWRWWYMFKEPLFWVMLALVIAYFLVGYLIKGTPPWPLGGTGS